MTTPQDTIHPIGSTVYFRGEPVTITSEPYTYCGGEFQDGTAEDGRTLSIATPREVNRNAQAHRDEFKRQQAAFRRIRERAAEVSQ